MSKLSRALLLVAVAFLPFVAVADNPIAYRIGPGAQMTCSTSAPSHVSTRGMYWCNSADGNRPYYTDPSGSDSAMDGGNGGTGVFDVKTYGAKGDCITDDTNAIKAAVAAAPVGSTIFLRHTGLASCYLISDTIPVTRDYIRVVGDGVSSTVVKFNPASTKSAFKFANGATEMYGDAITGIRFVSTGSNTQKKTAVEVVDTSGMLIEDIWIDPQNSSTWTGSTSVGLAIKGRELTRINRVRAFTDQPIQLSDDPNTSGTVDNDHMHMSDTYLRPTPSGSGTRAAVTIDDGVIISNLTIDGANAWIVDKYGLYWVETGGTSATATNIAISGVRCEQAVDATGYCIYVDHTKGIYNFEVRDAQISTNVAQNGMHFFGINNLTIRNSVFGVADAARQHLNITGSVKDLLLENNYVNATTPSTLTGLVLISAQPQVTTSASIPSTAWYSDTSTATGHGMTTSSLDATSAAQLPIGANVATGIALGRTGGSGVVVNDPILTFNHLKGGTSAPTIAIVGSPTQLGTSPAFAVINGNDTALNLSITVGTAPAAFASHTPVSLATVSFNKTYTGGTPTMALVPVNSEAAFAMAQGVQFFFNRASNSTVSGNIRAIANGTPTLTASVVLEFAMVAIQ